MASDQSGTQPPGSVPPGSGQTPPPPGWGAPPASMPPPGGPGAGGPPGGWGSPPPGPPPGFGGPPPGFGGPPAAGGGGGKGLVIALVGVGAVALIAVAAVAVLMLRGGPDLDIRLEPIAVATPDPFTPSVASAAERPVPRGLDVPARTVTELPPEPDQAQPAADLTALSAPPPPPRQVVGSLPGLYGGTRNDAVCDPDQLIAFLESEPEKAAAWAGVFALPPTQIRSFIEGLTPVVLTRDTRVTNHGFRNGEATQLQSVLQAGTAVMVDDRGVPRIKCGCGNPLLPPAVLDRDLEIGFEGDPWPGFRVEHWVEIVVDINVEVFVLVDLDGDKPFTRETGSRGEADGELVVDDLCSLFPDDPVCRGDLEGDDLPGGFEPDPDEPVLGTGDVQATLRWRSDADLDLRVVDPTGEEIYFGNRNGASGGQLDVDVIPCSSPDIPRVENIFWPDGQAPGGTYTIRVNYWSTCNDQPPQEFSIQVRVDGQLVLDETGSLTEPGETQEWTIEVAGGAPAASGGDGGTAAPAPGGVGPNLPPAGAGASQDDVEITMEGILRSCALFPTQIDAGSLGDDWWVVSGIAVYQSGEEVFFGYFYNAATGELQPEDEDSAALVDPRFCA